MTPEETSVVLVAARQAVRFAKWHADKQRRLEKGKGDRFRFSEPTGEEVIDKLTGSDTERWARLASAALVLSRDPAFQEWAGE